MALVITLHEKGQIDFPSASGARAAGSSLLAKKPKAPQGNMDFKRYRPRPLQSKLAPTAAASFAFTSASGPQGDQAQMGFGENGAFVDFVEFLPGTNLALAAAATDADVIGEFADADAGVFGGTHLNPPRQWVFCGSWLACDGLNAV